MALTDLQKAQNKAAALVRNRAHNARAKQHRAALAAAESDALVSQAYAAYQAANQACEEAVQRNRSEIEKLRQQIEALQEQARALERNPLIEELASARRTASDAWQRQKTAALNAVEAQYPDLQGSARFSAAAWSPPAEVLKAMEQARAAATAETQ